MNYYYFANSISWSFMKYMNLRTFKTESYYISDILIKIKDEGMDEEVIKNDVSFKQFS